jgi:hypothetical protein
MKCFAAHFVYWGGGKVLSKQVLCLNDDGTLRSVRPLTDEMASTSFFNGLICPAFGLPGNNQLLTPAEATLLLRRVQSANPELTLDELLATYTELPALQVGTSAKLWCMEPIDLKKLLVQENTSVYSIFP